MKVKALHTAGAAWHTCCVELLLVIVMHAVDNCLRRTSVGQVAQFLSKVDCEGCYFTPCAFLLSGKLTVVHIFVELNRWSIDHMLAFASWQQLLYLPSADCDA